MNELLSAVIVLGVMGVVFSIILSIAAKAFHVPVDWKVKEISDALPGANCGACGFPGCDGLANAIAAGDADINACPIGGQDLANRLAEIMGTEAGDVDKEVAVVMCQGSNQRAPVKYNYVGLNDCRAIALELGGNKACTYGCLGAGTCKEVCVFDAVVIEDGLAIIDKDKCTACLKCVEVCPKNLIKMLPYKQEVMVKCNSHDPGRDVRGACSVGCIGCVICSRAYEGGFELDNNLAHAIYDLDNPDEEALAEAIEKCPNSCIYPGLELKERAVEEPVEEAETTAV